MSAWEKIERTVNAEGTTITYRNIGTPFLIQSHKRHIPHTNRPGTWDHTSFFVLANGHEIKEFSTLKDAKAYIERRQK